MSGIEGLELGALLGSGGFADVYEAYEQQFGRTVAVKIFRSHVSGADRKSFEREAQATGRLSGVRNIVHVYRSGFTDDDHPYLVMERMEYSMAALVGHDDLTTDRVVRIGVAIGEALQVAHSEGILHRDLKPENILVDRYGEPAISDFGISSIIDMDGSSSIYGFTAEHAAPELFEEAASTPASDVYSLAATLFTLTEGQPPFAREQGEGPLSFMTRVVRSPCPPCERAGASLPQLDNLIRTSLEKDPSARPELASFVGMLKDMSVAVAEQDGSDTAGNPGPLHAIVPDTVSAPGGYDTVVGRGASKLPPNGPNAGSGSGNGSEPPRKQPKRKLLLAGLASTLILAVILVLVLLPGTRNGRKESGSGSDPKPTTSSNGDTTTDQSETKDDDEGSVASDGGPAGVANARPLSQAGVLDTSGRLRSHIDEFASATDVSWIQRAPVNMPRDSTALKFGTLPALIDYGAFNDLKTSECYRLILHDLTVVGASANIWIDGSDFMVVNAVEVQSPKQARQYYWAAALFTGLESDGCDGWPDNGIAIDPDDLSVERNDFTLATGADEMITAITSDPHVEPLEADIAYGAVARVDNIVVVAIAGRLSGKDSTSDNPDQYVPAIGQAIKAFVQP